MSNNKIVLVLSGEIATGKSTLASSLQKDFNFEICSTREKIIELAIAKHSKQKLIDDRSILQKFGEKLDKESKGNWVMQNFQDIINKNERIIIESARTQEQIDSLRKAYAFHVIHVHLFADPETLKERFILRELQKNPGSNVQDIEIKYLQYKEDKTEKQIGKLKDKADLIISTEKKVLLDVFIRVSSFLKLLGPINKPLVDVLIGAQFGSEGKGQIAGYLSKEYDCLVRVGGPNAGHQVYNEVNEKREPDIFHIIPSGARKNPEAKIIIGPGAVISVEIILDEIRKFNIDSPERLIIDPNVTIITQKDIDLENKINKIGGTSKGVGAATAANILARLEGNMSNKAINEKRLKQYIKPAHEELEKLFRLDKKVLLEGTQGTFLSLHNGIYPYVTSRETTVAGCLSEAGIAINRVRKIILVTRTYPIRVESPADGTSGPFTNPEIDWKIISERCGVTEEELLEHEKTTSTRRKRRVAEFSWYELRKACELNSPTDIALTFADYFSVKNRDARRFDQLTPMTTEFIEEVERCSGVPVSLISTRFAFRSIIDRRNW